MTPEPIVLDPELEGILREVASDPRSRLLKVERTGSIGELINPNPITAAVAGLTVAERHLVDVYREELAWTLRELAVTSLFASEAAGLWLHRSISVGEQLHVREVPEIVGMTRALPSPEPDPLIGVRGILEGLVAQAAEGVRVDPSEAATASLRLVPADRARICAAHYLGQLGEHDAALRVLQGTVSGLPSSVDASFAWENIGMIQSKSGLWKAAIASYMHASRLARARAEPILNWAFNAYLAGEWSEFDEIVARLDGLVAASDQCVKRFVSQLAAQRAGGYWSPPRHWPRLRRSVEKQLCDTTRRIADALE